MDHGTRIILFIFTVLAEVNVSKGLRLYYPLANSETMRVRRNILATSLFNPHLETNSDSHPVSNGIHRKDVLNEEVESTQEADRDTSMHSFTTTLIHSTNTIPSNAEPLTGEPTELDHTSNFDSSMSHSTISTSETVTTLDPDFVVLHDTLATTQESLMATELVVSVAVPNDEKVQEPESTAASNYESSTRSAEHVFTNQTSLTIETVPISASTSTITKMAETSTIQMKLESITSSTPILNDDFDPVQTSDSATTSDATEDFNQGTTSLLYPEKSTQPQTDSHPVDSTTAIAEEVITNDDVDGIATDYITLSVDTEKLEADPLIKDQELTTEPIGLSTNILHETAHSDFTTVSTAVDGKLSSEDHTIQLKDVSQHPAESELKTDEPTQPSSLAHRNETSLIPYTEAQVISEEVTDNLDSTISTEELLITDKYDDLLITVPIQTDQKSSETMLTTDETIDSVLDQKKDGERSVKVIEMTESTSALITASLLPDLFPGESFKVSSLETESVDLKTTSPFPTNDISMAATQSIHDDLPTSPSLQSVFRSSGEVDYTAQEIDISTVTHTVARDAMSTTESFSRTELHTEMPTTPSVPAYQTEHESMKVVSESSTEWMPPVTEHNHSSMSGSSDYEVDLTDMKTQTATMEEHARATTDSTVEPSSILQLEDKLLTSANTESTSSVAETTFLRETDATAEKLATSTTYNLLWSVDTSTDLENMYKVEDESVWTKVPEITDGIEWTQPPTPVTTTEPTGKEDSAFSTSATLTPVEVYTPQAFDGLPIEGLVSTTYEEDRFPITMELKTVPEHDPSKVYSTTEVYSLPSIQQRQEDESVAKVPSEMITSPETSTSSASEYIEQEISVTTNMPTDLLTDWTESKHSTDYVSTVVTATPDPKETQQSTMHSSVSIESLEPEWSPQARKSTLAHIMWSEGDQLTKFSTGTSVATDSPPPSIQSTTTSAEMMSQMNLHTLVPSSLSTRWREKILKGAVKVTASIREPTIDESENSKSPETTHSFQTRVPEEYVDSTIKKLWNKIKMAGHSNDANHGVENQRLSGPRYKPSDVLKYSDRQLVFTRGLTVGLVLLALLVVILTISLILFIVWMRHNRKRERRTLIIDQSGTPGTFEAIPERLIPHATSHSSTGRGDPTAQLRTSQKRSRLIHKPLSSHPPQRHKNQLRRARLLEQEALLVTSHHTFSCPFHCITSEDMTSEHASHQPICGCDTKPVTLTGFRYKRDSRDSGYTFSCRTCSPNNRVTSNFTHIDAPIALFDNELTDNTVPSNGSNHTRSGKSGGLRENSWQFIDEA